MGGGEGSWWVVWLIIGLGGGGGGGWGGCGGCGWFFLWWGGGGGGGVADGFWGRKVDILSLFAAGGRGGAVRIFNFLFFWHGALWAWRGPLLPFPILFYSPTLPRSIGCLRLH